MGEHRTSIPRLRGWCEVVAGENAATILALVEAVEAAERFFFGRAAEDELALAAALRRFDFGDGK